MKEILASKKLKSLIIMFHLYSSFGRVDYIGSTFVLCGSEGMRIFRLGFYLLLHSTGR